MKKLLFLFLVGFNATYSMMPRYSRNYYWASKVPGKTSPYCERRKWRRMCRIKKAEDAIKLQQLRAQKLIQ